MSLRWLAGGRHERGDPEVENLHLPVVCYEDICRLYVTMDDALRVSSLKSISRLYGVVEKGFEFDWSVADDLGERAALKPFHHDELLSIVLANFVNGANVRMIDARSCTRFLLKSQYSGAGARCVRRQTFQCNRTTKSKVFSLIDDAGRALSDHLKDTIMR